VNTTKAPRRLQSDTWSAAIMRNEEGVAHDVVITISRDSMGRPVEVLLSTGGKIGQGLDQLLVELGIAISRAMNHRDPTTGLPPVAAAVTEASEDQSYLFDLLKGNSEDSPVPDVLCGQCFKKMSSGEFSSCAQDDCPMGSSER
jgi:hypothetical protein